MSREELLVSHQAEVLTDPRELFATGRRIGERLERRLQSAIERFYEEAIPFAHRVWNERPWKHSEYSEFDDLDDEVAFLKFLRASFSDRKDKTSWQQAVVVRMIVLDGFDVDDVRGVGFRYLLMMAHVVKSVNREKRRELLVEARSAKNIVKFKSILDRIKTGLHLEDQEGKTLTGSESAARSIEDFDRRTRDLGDRRPVLDKLADAAQGALLDTDVDLALWSDRSIEVFCRWQRRREPSLEQFSNKEILGRYTYTAMRLTEDELDDETAREFTDLRETRP